MCGARALGLGGTLNGRANWERERASKSTLFGFDVTPFMVRATFLTNPATKINSFCRFCYSHEQKLLECCRRTSPTSKNEFEPFMAQKWHFLIRRQESTPTRSKKNCPNMLPSHVSNLDRHETTRLRLCSSCSKSLKSGSAVLMALDQPFCSERCRSEFVFTQATPNSEPYTRAYRQRSEGQGVFISDPKRSKDSPQSPREFIQLYPVTQPRWSESSLAT
jgi:endogenous inhibitor of DNA gyrase (YacG/DUF329 family)